MRHPDQHQLRALAHVESVLFNTWDPLGVNGHAESTLTEYDSYAPKVLGMLQHGASAARLERHLENIEVSWMGLMKPALDAQRSKAVRELVVLRRSTE